MTNNKAVKGVDDVLICWKELVCNDKTCPNFGKLNPYCWLVSYTHCRGVIRSTSLEKMEVCLDCEIFRKNVLESDVLTTFNTVSKQFARYNEEIQRHQKQLKLANTKLDEERKNLEKRVEEKTLALRHLQTKLMNSSKMAAVGAFSAGIAHQINNPLAGILNGIRSIINGNVESEERQKEYLQLSLEGLMRIQDTVKQILAFSSRHEPVFAQCDLIELVNCSVSFIQSRLNDKSIRLTKKLPEKEVVVQADCLEIQHVLLNLLCNAVDAVQNNGKISVKLEAHKNKAVIKIKDNGTGIKDEVIGQIFDAFFSTKPFGQGTGLGLAICNSIVKKHYGHIDVKSTKRGAEFIVSLPYNQTVSKTFSG